MNQLITIDLSLKKAFDTIENVDLIVKFMLWYFQEYAYFKHLELDFATCLKEVNENLSNQAKEASKSSDVSLVNKARLWLAAHDKFEEQIRSNLVSIVKKYSGGQSLFDIHQDSLWITAT